MPQVATATSKSSCTLYSHRYFQYSSGNFPLRKRESDMGIFTFFSNKLTTSLLFIKCPTHTICKSSSMFSTHSENENLANYSLFTSGAFHRLF